MGVLLFNTFFEWAKIRHAKRVWSGNGTGLDQTAQEILDKEKERQEQKRKVILRGGGGVEKNW